MSNATQRRGSYAVFRRDTGQVECWFHVDVFEGAEMPSQAFIRQEALAVGSRHSGRPESAFDLLHVVPSQLNRKASYIVDLDTRNLKDIAR
jgi:hypothetical protein